MDSTLYWSRVLSGIECKSLSSLRCMRTSCLWLPRRTRTSTQQQEQVVRASIERNTTSIACRKQETDTKDRLRCPSPQLWFAPTFLTGHLSATSYAGRWNSLTDWPRPRRFLPHWILLVWMRIGRYDHCWALPQSLIFWLKHETRPADACLKAA